MPTQLTEVQAWEEVARRFAEGMTRGAGLCVEIEDLYYNTREIPWSVYGKMIDVVDSYLAPNQTWAYETDYEDDGENFLGECIKNDEGRALGALWLMCEAAEEQGVTL